jgi:MoaA/NifB/PqqE/SkfB family radical SAM enzyme
MRDEYNSVDLDPALLERFLKEFSLHSKQRSRHSFTGGEPTVHNDLDGLFAAFRNTGHSLYIVSNGQNEKGVESVIRNKDVIDYMSLSLDAADRELNDMTRGRGTFDKVIENTKIYIKNGVEVDFRFVIHDRNAEYLERTFELASELGLKRLRFSTLHPIAKNKAKTELSVTYEVLMEAYRNVLRLREKYPKIAAGMNTRHMIPYHNPEWPKEMCTPISGALNGITMLPDGKILFCCDFVDLSFDYSRYDKIGDNVESYSPVIGDYNTDSLETIKKRKLKHIRELKMRRQKDVAEGNITGNRQYICENCKYYHFYK